SIAAAKIRIAVNCKGFFMMGTSILSIKKNLFRPSAKCKKKVRRDEPSSLPQWSRKRKVI
ncbi:MAG: hypothetical protein WBZ35_15680, partial [Pseudolabrys sp.]